MAAHYTKKDARFQVEFRSSDRATAHGGQLALNALWKHFGLWERVKRARALGANAKGKSILAAARRALLATHDSA